LFGTYDLSAPAAHHCEPPTTCDDVVASWDRVKPSALHVLYHGACLSHVALV
jgi:hypothetical protein